MAEHKHPEGQPAHIEFDTSHAEGRMNWVFFEFWPIMIWVGVFVLMCALPLTLSGMMHNPFSAADVVWPGYGLLLAAEFVLALVIFILFPRLVMPYFTLITIYGLIAAEQGKAWRAGWVSDGAGHTWMISNIAILFLTYVLVGWFVMVRDDMASRKRERL